MYQYRELSHILRSQTRLFSIMPCHCPPEISRHWVALWILNPEQRGTYFIGVQNMRFVKQIYFNSFRNMANEPPRGNIHLDSYSRPTCLKTHKIFRLNIQAKVSFPGPQILYLSCRVTEFLSRAQLPASILVTEGTKCPQLRLE